MFFEKVDNTSCLMRAIWDWTDDFISYKWSNPRQTYRPPSRIDGQTVVKTRNRVRGSGNSVSFLLESEDANPLHIYGWAFNLQSTTEE